MERAEGTGVLPPAGQRVRDVWRRPRWTKYRHGWAITEPPGESFRQGQVVNVVNHTTGVTKERRLARLLGEKAVEPGLKLRVWQPAR